MLEANGLRGADFSEGLYPTQYVKIVLGMCSYVYLLRHFILSKEKHVWVKMIEVML